MIYQKMTDKKPLGKLLKIYIVLIFIGIAGISTVVLLPNWLGSLVIFLFLIFIIFSILAAIKLILIIKFLRHPVLSAKEVGSQVGSKTFVTMIIASIVIGGILSAIIWFLYRFGFIK